MTGDVTAPCVTGGLCLKREDRPPGLTGKATLLEASTLIGSLIYERNTEQKDSCREPSGTISCQSGSFTDLKGPPLCGCGLRIFTNCGVDAIPEGSGGGAYFARRGMSTARACGARIRSCGPVRALPRGAVRACWRMPLGVASPPAGNMCSKLHRFPNWDFLH